MTDTAVVVDVGATWTQAGFGGWEERQEPIYSEDSPDTRDGLVRTLRRLTDELVSVARSADRKVERIAVGLPGWVDSDGRLVESPHAPFGGLDINAELGNEVDVPFVVENDANAQALGCAEGSETVCYVALGTGVGGGVVEAGSLLKGANGFAGEVGHIPVSGSDRPCPCGKEGCLGTVASGESLRKDLGDSWWERELSPDEERRVEEAGEAVGEAASVLAALNDPTRVVVAGSLTRREGFMAGVTKTWDHPWTDCSLETVGDTWDLARDGLTRLARKDTDK